VYATSLFVLLKKILCKLICLYHYHSLILERPLERLERRLQDRLQRRPRRPDDDDAQADDAEDAAANGRRQGGDVMKRFFSVADATNMCNKRASLFVQSPMLQSCLRP
jgi:hypothetical protein